MSSILADPAASYEGRIAARAACMQTMQPMIAAAWAAARSVEALVPHAAAVAHARAEAARLEERSHQLALALNALQAEVEGDDYS